MKEVKQIAHKVLVLGLDILLFTWQVVRRVILPTRSRKGNVLTSLLAIFVGLLEKIVSFEKSILQRPVVFTHKYVKQGLIIIVGFLFLLTSFEWTIGPSASTSANGTADVVACAPVATPSGAVAQRRVIISNIAPLGIVAPSSFDPTSSLFSSGPPVVGKRWLRLRVFRI